MGESIRFNAALAGQNTAARWLSVGSDGDSKITLEVASTDLAQVMRLAALGGKSFTVTVEE